MGPSSENSYSLAGQLRPREGEMAHALARRVRVRSMTRYWELLQRFELDLGYRLQIARSRKGGRRSATWQQMAAWRVEVAVRSRASLSA